MTAVLLAPGRAHGGGLAALRAARGRVVVEQEVGLADFSCADLVLDGIVGIGGRGGLRPEAEPYARAARTGVVVAVDVPSGVDADTGEVAGAALRADVTVCFGTHKPGLLIDPGASYAGAVQLVGIGLELPCGRRDGPPARRRGRPAAGAGRGERQVPARRGRGRRRFGAVPGGGAARGQPARCAAARARCGTWGRRPRRWCGASRRRWSPRAVRPG